jgi:metallo-beta-lactamase class B
MYSRRLFLAGALSGSACSSAPAWAGPDGSPDIWELALPDMERLGPTVWIKALAPNVWVTSFTFETPDLGWVPCNGMIVGDPAGATIVDTGNTYAQGQLLLDAAKRLTGKPATQAVATHFHNDRTGGIAAVRAAGLSVFAHPFSVGLAQAYGERVPDALRGLDKGPVTLGPVELFYPGVGHARDNITAWHAPSATLFGGCLLRATTDKQLGSLGDGDIEAFPATLERLAKRYPSRRFVIPGHGSVAGDALTWTQGRVKEVLARK